MQRYKNLGGDSGIDAYEIAPGSITVRFSDGKNYRYTDASAGADSVRRMQELADSGQGLNEFINRVVKKNYAEKW